MVRYNMGLLYQHFVKYVSCQWSVLNLILLMFFDSKLGQWCCNVMAIISTLSLAPSSFVLVSGKALEVWRSVLDEIKI